MIVALVLAANLTVVGDLPRGITCEYVRQQYNTYWWVGKTALRLFLKDKGWTSLEIRTAEQCIKERS